MAGLNLAMSSIIIKKKYCKIECCGKELIIGENWMPSCVKQHNYICVTCLNKYNRECNERRRRAAGIQPRPPDWGKKYGVSSVLPNGKMNPEYKTAWNRAHGTKPRVPSKYGVPARLPNGKHNPEYQKAVCRAKGIGPKKPIGQNKYGIPSVLPDGSKNPEYQRRCSETQRRAKGIQPRKPSKYGVPYKLPDGGRNPEWWARRGRAKGYKPRKAGDNRYGVPKFLPNGKTNPEYTRRYYASPEGKLNQKKANAKRKIKRRQLPPLKIIVGEPFKDSNLHHMTKLIGMWVPKWLNALIPHNVWTGKNMELINILALEWYIQTH